MMADVDDFNTLRGYIYRIDDAIDVGLVAVKQMTEIGFSGVAG
jgi:hypothetical protein